MGMNVGASSGKKGQAHPEMNVTPLVDVVLVLLIIFNAVASSSDKILEAGNAAMFDMVAHHLALHVGPVIPEQESKGLGLDVDVVEDDAVEIEEDGLGAGGQGVTHASWEFLSRSS